MKAGRDLDALVAEKVMGIRVEYYSGQLVEKVNPDYIKPGCYPMDYLVPYYSTSIAAAWQVLDRLDCFIDLSSWEPCYKWVCEIKNGFGNPHVGKSHTAPHAICLAALKTVGVDIESEKEL